MTLLEMAQNSPGFKAFCRRKLTVKVLSPAARRSAANKAFQAKFKAFCRRRGINSILKENEYSTGAGPSHEPVMARLSKKNGEFVSEILNGPPIAETSRDAESEAA
jgi:hypothetical protein